MIEDIAVATAYAAAMDPASARTAVPASTSARILLCPPTHFGVEYVINPWMEGQLDQVDRARAQSQWQALQGIVGELARPEIIAAGAGLPDMPFTANAGLVFGDAFVPSRFRHAQRQGEEALFTDWFRRHSFRIVALPDGLDFEGAGDALFDRAASHRLWMGHGHRSDIGVADFLAGALGIEVLPLRLIDPRFYHLDTCFCPLRGGWLLYFPAAFDDTGRALIESRVPASRRIVVAEEDALHFACNAVNLEDAVILNRAGPALREALAAAGFRTVETPLDEFLKAGGAAKCLTLRLDEPPQYARAPA